MVQPQAETFIWDTYIRRNDSKRNDNLSLGPSQYACFCSPCLAGTTMLTVKPVPYPDPNRYGYCTQTNYKFILVLADTKASDSHVQQVLTETLS